MFAIVRLVNFLLRCRLKPLSKLMARNYIRRALTSPPHGHRHVLCIRVYNLYHPYHHHHHSNLRQKSAYTSGDVPAPSSWNRRKTPRVYALQRRSCESIYTLYIGPVNKSGEGDGGRWKTRGYQSAYFGND